MHNPVTVINCVHIIRNRKGKKETEDTVYGAQSSLRRRIKIVLLRLATSETQKKKKSYLL